MGAAECNETVPTGGRGLPCSPDERCDRRCGSGRHHARPDQAARQPDRRCHPVRRAFRSPPPPPVPLPDNLASLYRERIAELAATLEDPDHRIETRDRLRPLIERVAVRFRTADARGVEIELESDLVALLSLGLSPNAPKAGAAGAAGLRKQVRSVMVGCGGTHPPKIDTAAGAGVTPTVLIETNSLGWSIRRSKLAWLRATNGL